MRRLEGTMGFVIFPVSRHFQKRLDGWKVRMLEFLHNSTEPSATLGPAFRIRMASLKVKVRGEGTDPLKKN